MPCHYLSKPKPNCRFFFLTIFLPFFCCKRHPATPRPVFFLGRKHAVPLTKPKRCRWHPTTRRPTRSSLVSGTACFRSTSRPTRSSLVSGTACFRSTSRPTRSSLVSGTACFRSTSRPRSLKLLRKCVHRLLALNYSLRLSRDAVTAAHTGTQFTCFTGTKVHILTLRAASQPALRQRVLSLLALLALKYTC
jgi:hypothetical protein